MQYFSICVRCAVVVVVLWAVDRGVEGAAAQDLTGDIVIYGCTVAGVAAAVTAKSFGRPAIMICPEDHIGGMTVSGLSWTDFGKTAALGGIAETFYRRIKEHYDDYTAWARHDPAYYTEWRRGEPYIKAFEPHVAESILREMVADSGARIVHAPLLEDGNAVEKDGARIIAVRLTNGMQIAGAVFLDATYVGDLAARAGASFVVGRESRDQYGESLNGALHVQPLPRPLAAQISGYVVEGDPSSGLLPGLIPESELTQGAADHRVQAYNFRLCMTRDPDLRVAFTKPADYKPLEYALLARHIKASGPDVFYDEVFQKFDPVPNGKIDKNNAGPVSTDFVGRNYAYPTGSYEERLRIVEEHESYTRGLFWFLANDPQVPERVRRRMATYGLCGDEFTSNGNWPYELYVREARRLVGEMVMTQAHLLGEKRVAEPIALGSYRFDSHYVSRYVDASGWVHNEGAFSLEPQPYAVSYRAITPKRDEVTNLLVPVALSATHAAYGSIRMEPVFMMVGQSAATAAALALARGVAVQDLPYSALRDALLASGQVLEVPNSFDLVMDRFRSNPRRMLLFVGVALTLLVFGFVVGWFARFLRFPRPSQT